MKKIKASDLRYGSALCGEITSKIYKEIYHFLKTNELYDAVIDELQSDDEGEMAIYELPIISTRKYAFIEEFNFCINKVIFSYYVSYLKENNIYHEFRKYHKKNILIKYFADWNLSIEEQRNNKVVSWYNFIYFCVINDYKVTILNNLLTINKRWNGNKTTEIND